MTYDPAFMNTAFLQEPHNVHRRVTKASSNTALPIDQLAEKSSYFEVAYLLHNGELPTESELKTWNP